MKVRVTIRSSRSGSNFRVRADVARLIVREISLAKRTRVPRIRIRFAVDNEARISVHRSVKVERYTLQGPARIEEESKRRSWAFPFGVQIVDWLEQADRARVLRSVYPLGTVPFLKKIP
jgi:hypothetical protein